MDISEHSNALDPDLAREMTEKLRVNKEKREAIIDEIAEVVSHWRKIAAQLVFQRMKWGMLLYILWLNNQRSVLTRQLPF